VDSVILRQIADLATVEDYETAGERKKRIEKTGRLMNKMIASGS